MYSIFRIILIAVIAFAFIVIGYAFDHELRTKYHESAPRALIITGSVMGFLAFLGSMQMTAFKKGDFLGYFGIGIAIRTVVDFMFEK